MLGFLPSVPRGGGGATYPLGPACGGGADPDRSGPAAHVQHDCIVTELQILLDESRKPKASKVTRGAAGAREGGREGGSKREVIEERISTVCGRGYLSKPETLFEAALLPLLGVRNKILALGLTRIREYHIR